MSLLRSSLALVLTATISAVGMAAPAGELSWELEQVVTLGEREFWLYRAFCGDLPVDGLRRTEVTSGSNVTRFDSPRGLSLSELQIECDTEAHLLQDSKQTGSLLYELEGSKLRLVARRFETVPSPDGPRRDFEIRYDPLTQATLSIRELTRFADVSGVVLGRIPEDSRAFTATVAFEDRPLPGLEVASSGIGVFLTDENGFFCFDAPTGAIASITLSGDTYNVESLNGPDIGALLDLSPGDPAQTLILNSVPTEFQTSQVAAFEVIARSIVYFANLAPDLTAPRNPLNVFVNATGSCFAVYSPLTQSMNFSAAGGGCPNAAYGTIVAHEYFHHVEAGLSVTFTAPYAEAMADVFAGYLLNTPFIGLGFFGQGSVLRFLDGAIVFPNDDPDPAQEGLPLSQSFWDLKEFLEADLGPAEGAARAAELWFGSLLIGDGVVSSQVVADLLFLDDDDGDLGNGTPNQAAIVSAFQLHGFSAPPGPVTDLACVTQENRVVLTYELPNTPLDGVTVYRNGSPIAELILQTTYIDLFPPAGTLNYAIEASMSGLPGPAEQCTTTVEPYTSFVRGDADNSGTVNLGDAVAVLTYLFQGSTDPINLDCFDSADSNDSGNIDITDPFYLLIYLFQAGPPPPNPFPIFGFDPTPDTLRCE